MGLGTYRSCALALALLVCMPASAQVYGDHIARCVYISSDDGTTTTCLCQESSPTDRIFHDTDCDRTKDAGEEWLDIAAAADLNDITNVTLTTPGDGAVLCFTGTSNNSVDCTVGGDATATEDTGTLTIAVNDDSHNHVITNIDAFTVAELQTQTSDVTTFYTEDTTVPVADGGTGANSLTDGGILLGSGTGAITALGVATNGQIPIGDGTTDPVLGNISGTANEITVTNGAGTITIDIPTSPTLDGTNFTGIPSSAITTEVRSMYWPAGGMSADGTNCADPTEVTLGSGPKLFTVICTDSDSSVINGSVVMPDGYTGGTVTFELSVLNDNATPSGDYDIDFSASCRGNSDVVNSTFGTEQAADVDFDTSGTCGGSACVTNEIAMVTTAAVTGDGTCAAGDMLFWQGALDATGTTATVADVHILGVKMEYPTNIGD